MSGKRRPTAALLLALFLLTTACGQKPEVHSDTSGLTPFGGGLAVNEEGQLVDAETGELVDPETGELLSGGSGSGTSGTTGGTGTTTTTTGGGPGSDTPGSDDPNDDTPGDDDPGDDQPGDDPAPPSGGSDVGVTADSIKIGLHAPITGAAPVPAPSFERGKDLYWNWMRENNEDIHGRHVEAVFENDNFNPSTAVAKCKEMVQEDEVFLLVGVAGADQIMACAEYAYSEGVPYLSGGVSELEVSSYPNYFALWMSYPEQAPLLVDMMVEDLGAGDELNGIVRFNTPGFSDGHEAFLAAASDAGMDVQFDRAVVKTAGQTEAQSMATQICSSQIQNVYVLTSPTFWLYLANAARQQCSYQVQWVGVGLTMTLDTVASVGCGNSNSVAGAKFFSPFPAYVNSNQFDSNFREAGGNDDIQFGLWGFSKTLRVLLDAAGENLTREGFVYSTERSGVKKTGVLPDTNFSPGDRFGGTTMHLNEVDCSQRRWVTKRPFVDDF